MFDTIPGVTFQVFISCTSPMLPYIAKLFTFYSLTSYHIFYFIWFSTFTVYFNFMCIYLNIFRSKSNMIFRKSREITFLLCPKGNYDIFDTGGT